MHFNDYAELKRALGLEPDAPGSFRFLPTFAPASLTCAQCGKAVSLTCEDNDCGTGYALTKDDAAICYACADENERRDLTESGKGYLYLSRDKRGHKLTNWPGTLEIRLHGAPRKGRHNLARVRHDVWFRLDGAEWHGVKYGEFTQICHVRRLKA